jgi:hypothetical protein
MSPTLQNGQIVTALKKRFKIGDIVIASVQSKEVIKRITAINYATKLVTLTGDNALDSQDSRTLGDVPMASVKGVVIWPRQKTLSTK